MPRYNNHKKTNRYTQEKTKGRKYGKRLRNAEIRNWKFGLYAFCNHSQFSVHGCP